MAALAEDALIARVAAVIGAAIAEQAPDLVVIACNTASTLALDELRARFAVPFVGTVPAIKPACAQSASKRISVLGTLATVGREYTRALIREFAADCAVDAGRLAAVSRLRRSRARRRAGRRCRNRRRDRALLRRGARGGAPIRWCSPARIIRCCSRASANWRPGRSTGSIRRRRSPAASPICCAGARPRRKRRRRRASFSAPAARRRQSSPRRSRVSAFSR